MINKKDIILTLNHVLGGQIYNDIRAIVYSYSKDDKHFLLRYYLSRHPNDDDFENISIVMAEFISHYPYSYFESIKEECIYSDLPIGELDDLDGYVYVRKE
jgi:hypothetical protein